MRVAAGLVLACCLVLVAASASADELRIKSVAITGLAGEQLKAAQRVIRARAGDLYSDKILQDDVMALLDLAFVEDAHARQATGAGGVEITYDVTPRTAVSGVNFRGNRKFKSGSLLREAGLDGFRHYDIARLTAARDLIVEKYKKAGYLFAKADFAAQPDGGVLFAIDEGPRLRVAVVNVLGNTAFTDAALKKNVRTATRRYLILPYRLDEATVEDDRLRLQEYCRDRGYLDASVAVTLNLTRDRKGIIVDYVIKEGSLYTVRSVQISGNARIPSAGLESALKMTNGTPFSSPRLDADVDVLRLAYGRVGCVDCAIMPSAVFAEKTPEVDVTYEISEGAPVEIGEIEIVGNDKTLDNVIRRELEFFPGETFNVEKLELSRRNLMRLSYFSKVDIVPDQVPPGTTPRNVTVAVEETSTGTFSIGLGVNSNTGLVGTLSVRQNNFDYRRLPGRFSDISEGRAWTGGGQSLELDVMPGTETSQFLLSYRDPRVDDSDYSLGLELHMTERQRHTYSERRTGPDVSLGRKIARYAYWEAGVTADTVRIHEVDPDAPPEIRTGGLRGTSQVNLLRFTLGHDTRNNLFWPTQGHVLAGTIEGSHGAIGSDFDFARARLSGNWYRTLSRDKLDRPFTFSWRARISQLLPQSREDAPIFERLFVGGAYDLRGFEYRGIGPRYGDEALGGKLSASGSAEFEFPLAAEFLRAAFFYDTGTLVDRAADVSLDRVRHSVGFGLRFVIPGRINMPIAIDFAFPLKKDEDDQTQVISFTFGRMF